MKDLDGKEIKLRWIVEERKCGVVKIWKGIEENYERYERFD